MTTTETGPRAPRRSLSITVLRIVLPLLILAAGIGVGRHIYKTRPLPQRRPPMRISPLVSVMTAKRMDHTPELVAFGEVVPARQIDLVARVTGDVVAVHPAFREGGIIPVGERVIAIDAEDYRLAVVRAESAVARARLEYTVELGAAEVAQRERALLGADSELSPLEERLVKREPQRDAAQATLAAAEAELAQARLNLARTEIKAPFTAVVLSRTVELGGNVAPQKTIARLADAECYWVKVAVPLDRLRWIRMPTDGKAGATAVVRAGNGRAYPGTVIGVEGAVDARGRMARVLIAVQDPHGLRSGQDVLPLLLGDYVEAAIEGAALADVVRIPREALRDGDRIWVADADNRLVVREIDVVWSDRLQVYIRDGVEAGERIVVTPVGTPVPGVQLRIADGKAPAAETSAIVQESITDKGE
jgi:RND family efflux transporter MFP subunit